MQGNETTLTLNLTRSQACYLYDTLALMEHHTDWEKEIMAELNKVIAQHDNANPINIDY